MSIPSDSNAKVLIVAQTLKCALQLTLGITEQYGINPILKDFSNIWEIWGDYGSAQLHVFE